MLDSDLMFVIGLTVALLAVPSLLSAYSESRPPRSGAIMVLIAGVLLAVAVSQKPGGYSFSDIPEVYFRVIGRYL